MTDIVGERHSLAWLAPELLAGPWSAPTMTQRATAALGVLLSPRWLLDLVGELIARWPQRPTPAELDDHLAAPRRPHVHSRTDLLRLLSLPEGELDWFADVQLRTMRSSNPRLSHYRYRVIGPPDRRRLLEIPKPRLREVQRRLLRSSVGQLSLHPAAHGGVPGRSVRSCLSPHAASAVVIRCDLEAFFSSITAARVRGQFQRAGVERAAAELVAGLCTSAIPPRIWRLLSAPTSSATTAASAADLDVHWRTGRRLAVPHLPQGAPTSPVLANAIAYGLDVRLTALAERLGARYTRYVDDLIFSGPARLGVGSLLAGVRDIVRDEDFRLAEHKTKIRRQGQRQDLLGAVLNERVSVPRAEFDRLKAILHNCAGRGVGGQLRGAEHAAFVAELRGRIASVSGLDPIRGGTLQARFAAIDWTNPRADN